jgi:hypothetical protein
MGVAKPDATSYTLLLTLLLALLALLPLLPVLIVGLQSAGPAASMQCEAQASPLDSRQHGRAASATLPVPPAGATQNLDLLLGRPSCATPSQTAQSTDARAQVVVASLSSANRKCSCASATTVCAGCRAANTDAGHCRACPNSQWRASTL